VNTIIKLIAHICTAGAICSVVLVLAFVNPALAGPDCNRKPDHPSCGGGGGEPGETTCATSTTFPTFVYWDGTTGGGGGSILTLSDADGTCTQDLTNHECQFCIVGDTAFHYAPSTGFGRVIWTDKFVGTQFLLLEFSVTSPGNEVTVSVDSKIIAEGPWGSENGSVRDPDIAPDGDTLAFIYRWPNTGDPQTEGFTIYTASIDGCSIPSEPWDLLDPLGCSNSLSNVFSESSAANGGFYWNDLTFSADGMRIYVNQSIHTQENTGNPMPEGTYVVDQTNNIWGDYMYEPELPFPSTIASVDYDGSGPRELLAAGVSSESNPCGGVVVVDIEDCLSDDTLCGSIIGNNFPGRDPSWLYDDRLVYQERIYKRQGKNYSCKSGGMGIADPFPLDSSTMPTTVTDSGRDPLGWRRSQ